MASDAKALEAASAGLNGLLRASKDKGVLDDRGTVQKIAATLLYQSNVVSGVMLSPTVQSKYINSMFNQINNDLSEYIDMRARSNPKSLHHVYEWGMTGSKEGRLFEIKKTNTNGMSFGFGYNFIQSKVPVPSYSARRFIFANKAVVMENQTPVIVAPKYSKSLKFTIGDRFITMPAGKSVKIVNPGGMAVSKAFSSNYSNFLNSNLLENSIIRSGIKTKMEYIITNAAKVPGFIKADALAYSSAAIKNAANNAINASARGVM